MIVWLRKAWNSEQTSSLLLITLICLLTYGTLIPWLGFYWDDWFFVWVGHNRGTEGLTATLSIDRPFLGHFFAMNHFLLGEHPLFWHTYGLFIRLAAALALWWGLRRLWPKQRFVVMAVTLLFLTYPGFLQQPNAYVYQGAMASLMLMSLSLALTIWAETLEGRGQYLVLTALATVSGIASWLLWEVFVALEALRFVLLGYIARRHKQLNLRLSIAQALKHWLPHGLVTMLFLLWRVFWFSSPRAATDIGRVARAYSQHPLQELGRLSLGIPMDFLETTILSWAVPAGSRLFNASHMVVKPALLLGLVGAGLVLLWCQRATPQAQVDCSDDTSSLCAKELMSIGAFGVLLGLVPSLLAFRHVTLVHSWDRYTLPATIGGSLFAVGLLHFVVRQAARRWVLAGLLGLSIATHFANASVYQSDWQLQRELWWQFSWRVPQLQSDVTVLLSNPSHLDLVSTHDYTVWGAANLIYSSGEHRARLYGLHLSEEAAERIESAVVLKGETRDYRFQMDPSRILVATLPTASSCLHVVDAVRRELPSEADSLLRRIAPYSDVGLIRAAEEAVAPPAIVFGSEPPHAWCWYFEKADLARQLGDWTEVVRLGDEARDRNLYPGDSTEWLPFVEGYAVLGRCVDVLDLVGRIKQNGPRTAALAIAAACEN